MAEIRVHHTRRGFILSAHENGRQIGSVGFLRLREGHYRVRMLFVTEKHQGKGIGTKLMKAGLELCDSAEVGCPHNLVLFYTRLGFRIAKENRGGYELIWHGHKWSPYAQHTSICKKCGTVWYRGRWYNDDGKS